MTEVGVLRLSRPKSDDHVTLCGVIVYIVVVVLQLAFFLEKQARGSE
jgi:hypothetical protein